MWFLLLILRNIGLAFSIVENSPYPCPVSSFIFPIIPLFTVSLHGFASLSHLVRSLRPCLLSPINSWDTKSLSTPLALAAAPSHILCFLLLFIIILQLQTLLGSPCIYVLLFLLLLMPGPLWLPFWTWKHQTQPLYTSLHPEMFFHRDICIYSAFCFLSAANLISYSFVNMLVHTLILCHDLLLMHI